MPTLVAVVGVMSHLTLVELGDGITPRLEVDNAGQTLGWLDAHTLVVVDTPRDESRVVVTRYVDGVRADAITIPATEWPRPSFVELIFVGTDQVWLSKCVYAPGSHECADERSYLRVLPAPRITAAEPAQGSRYRATNLDRSPWPLPPDSRAPAGMTLELAEASTVTCRHDGASSVYPPSDYGDGMFTLRPFGARWISTRPPLYEVNAEEKNPADFINHVRRYFRPCEPKPLDDYAWLGDDRWAEWKGSGDSDDGTWTLWRGDKKIGTLGGTAKLRANVQR